ncbi:hypothetical protein GWK47_031334 [Chionoecetes opilio]|uniref:SGNH hydrolase-type esterase domain-containing protein n=1 Tax=Chionoecetes opilio TaxID=41210 RepID=A0A8J4Y3Q2_CHIOP|nr:hypothetical protein GWK47_049169 [Chionoecetes opilio]KAG0728971.1 hypothetical protein GWK47_031334 [Chionoecetes opilio]
MEICGVLEGVVEGVATADVAAGGQEVAVLPTEEVGVAQATCNQRMEEVVNVYILCGGCDMLRSSVRECVVCALQEQVKVLQEEVKGLKGVVDEGNVGTGMLVSTMQGEVKDLQQKVHSLEEGVEVRQAGVVTRPASGGTRPKEGEWRVVGKGSKPGSAGAEKSGEVPLHNRYAVLGEEDMGVKSRGVEEQQAGDRSGKGPEVVLVGDSQVKYLDQNFCERDRDRRTRVCYPGASVQDVTDRLDRLMVGTGKDAVVVVHVGGNDVGKARSEELVTRYKALLEKVKESGRKGVICGVIPREYVGQEWLSRALSLNSKIEELCKDMGLRFVDGWDTFYGKHSMYTRDGVHLSKMGTEAYGDQLEKAVRLASQGN